MLSWRGTGSLVSWVEDPLENPPDLSIFISTEPLQLSRHFDLSNLDIDKLKSLVYCHYCDGYLMLD